MKIQKSYKGAGGTLYLVATPIGNLKDITLRALEVLREVDIVACEDTRQTIKLLNHYEISKPLISYYQHNELISAESLLSELASGKSIALVSDAGTPAISDPGYELVTRAIATDIAVVPIPGANAAINGLIASGLATDRFTFVGFLPREKKEINAELSELRGYRGTLIFYEAPHRIKRTLTIILEMLGDREAVLVRELSKLHEEFLRGHLSEIAEHFKEYEPRGEIMIVVEGASKEILAAIEASAAESAWWHELTLNEHVDHYVRAGLTSKDAIKQVALERDLAKNQVYNDYHK